MEARGLEFVRYADDCIIMVGSEMAAKAKELTSRSWGVGNRYKIEKLNQLIRGWINYYKIGSMKSFCTKTDKHIRYRLRMCIWKHWKTAKNKAKNLMKLGVPKDRAYRAAYTKGIARICRTGDVQMAITNKRLAEFGLISMSEYYVKRRVKC
jgi:hypothetical protein